MYVENIKNKSFDIGIADIVLLIAMLYEFIYLQNKIIERKLNKEEIEKEILLLILLYIMVIIAYVGFIKFEINNNAVIAIGLVFYVMGLKELHINPKTTK